MLNLTTFIEFINFDQERVTCQELILVPRHLGFRGK